MEKATEMPAQLGNREHFTFNKMFIGGMLVITKGYGVRATTIEGQNAFAPWLCFA